MKNMPEKYLNTDTKRTSLAWSALLGEHAAPLVEQAHRDAVLIREGKQGWEVYGANRLMEGRRRAEQELKEYLEVK